MLIECVIERPEPVIVPIGNEVYHFEEDARGRKVAEVWIESHIECFLAVKHLYRPARELEPREKAKQNGVKPAQPEKGVVELRAEYQKATGKRAFNGWDAAALSAKIAAAKG